MAIRDRIKEVINKYVSENGTDTILTDDEIRTLIGIKKGSCQFTDYCYNNYNEGLDKKGEFESEDRLFQKISTNKYKILGSFYPYTGEAFQFPGKYNEHVVGYWEKGKFYKMSEAHINDRKEYLKKAEYDVAEIEDLVKQKGLEGADRVQIVKARVNQGAFRKQLIIRYKHCCLCGVSNENLLIASHIKSWVDALPKEKIDVNNGLLLCPNHDKLFDNGYISFDNDGKILISNDLEKDDRIFMNINDNMSINLYEESKEYMAFFINYICLFDYLFISS